MYTSPTVLFRGIYDYALLVLIIGRRTTVKQIFTIHTIFSYPSSNLASYRRNLIRELEKKEYTTMSLLTPPENIQRILQESVPDSVFSDSADGVNPNEDVLSYVAFLGAGLAEVEEFGPDTWKEQLGPYLEDIKEVGDDEIEAFRIAVAKETLGEDDESYGDEDDDGFEEVCNLRFK